MGNTALLDFPRPQHVLDTPLSQHNHTHIILFETANGWMGNEVAPVSRFTIRVHAFGMVDNAAHISQCEVMELVFGSLTTRPPTGSMKSRPTNAEIPVSA